MKTLFLAVLTAIVISSCAKDPKVEPCTSTAQSICTHTIVNSWFICKSPTTGKDSIFNHSGWITIDTMFVCDTAQWLIDAREYNADQYRLCDPKDQWMMEAFPSSCGCQ